MPKINLKQGVIYKITKASTNKEVVEGDQIKLESDGSLLCVGAGGWLDREDVESALKGAEYEIDFAYGQSKIDHLEQRIQELKELYKRD